MWCGQVLDFNNCKGLSKEIISLVLGFIKDNNMAELPNGRYDLPNGDYVVIFEYTTQANNGVFEAHKEYIDIHYTIYGDEKILWANEYLEEIKPYQVAEDYSLGTVSGFSSNGSCNQLHVFFRDEPHKAGVVLNEPMKVKKAVFKVRGR